MKRAVIYIFCLLYLVSDLRAQTVFQPKQSDFALKGIIYNEELSGDIRFHTNGFSISINTGKVKTYYKTTFTHYGIGYINDPREKSQNKNIALPSRVPSRSYLYGKRNNLIILRAGKGAKRYLTDKSKRKGVSIGYQYEAGPTLGLLKPYYLNLIYLQDVSTPTYEIIPEKYDENNRDIFLDENSIYGGTKFSRGLDEMKIVPGIQAHVGLMISLGAYEEYVKNLQIGIMADLFIKKMPIMVETENVSAKPYFINLYVNFQFGKRTN